MKCVYLKELILLTWSSLHEIFELTHLHKCTIKKILLLSIFSFQMLFMIHLIKVCTNKSDSNGLKLPTYCLIWFYFEMPSVSERFTHCKNNRMKYWKPIWQEVLESGCLSHVDLMWSMRPSCTAKCNVLVCCKCVHRMFTCDRVPTLCSLQAKIFRNRLRIN